MPVPAFTSPLCCRCAHAGLPALGAGHWAHWTKIDQQIDPLACQLTGAVAVQ